MIALDKPKWKLSFSAKILVPVVALLVLLPGLMLFVVHRSSVQQLEREARQQLRTADAVFQNSLELRSRQLLARYHSMVDSTFAAVAALKHAPTMSYQLSERLETLDGDADVMLFLDETGFSAASAQRDPHLKLLEFEKGASAIIEKALSGQPSATILPVEASVFNAVAVPVLVHQKIVGVLVVGARITLNTLKELTGLVGGDGVFVANSNVAASTLTKSEVHASKLPHWNTTTTGGGGVQVQGVLIDESHYLALASKFPGAPPNADLGYVLLLSYEPALQQLKQTQATLWIISAIGLLISAVVIWVVIGRITAPLRELRAVADAVGNGDYSRKVQVPSADELGQLAYAFNHMTKNIRHSHADLRQAVQTLKATQAQLIQSEKLSAVGEFVAGVAHELNNPLTSVIGFAELLKQAELQPRQRSYVQYIVKSTERCHKIVQGLLSFARQHPPERVLLNVNDMIGGVLEILAYELRTSNIEIVRDFESDLPKILGDSHQLQQVVLNILNNARQAIEGQSQPGRICLRTKSDETHVRIFIEDNGPGISGENLRKIFDPFFTTKPIGKGTGLGLSLCYGIVREHGGTIVAESIPGRGASFIIELPAQRGPAATPNSHRAQSSSLDGHGKRVLVIDDEEWILELVRQILEQDGFQVDLAAGGTAALDHVSRSEYDFLICDWKMPGLSGPQLYERIAETKPAAANRLMFMTGDVVSDSFQQFLQQHTKTCLSKPFSVQDLRQSVEEFLAELPAREKEFARN